MQQKKAPIFEETTIKKEVQKICTSSHFKSKELLCRFLNYIVSEHLAGRGENIKGYSIGRDVFNRGEDFDPAQDALVRIHAGRLRRMLQAYYQKEGKYDKIRIEVPLGSYNPLFSYIEVSDSQLVETSESETKIPIPFGPTVAIIPFKNFTGDPEKEFFALGFSEELSIELTRYDMLSVYNVSYSRALQDDNSVNFELFQKKGIRFIIEGSVNQSINQVRILVKLTDVNEGRQIWAERYDQSFSAENLNEAQETIAKEVVRVLGSEYGIILKKLLMDSQRLKPQQLDTYISVLRFYNFQMYQTPETAIQAFNALNQAIQKEPSSGIATAMLSIMYGNTYMLDLPDAEESYLKMGILAEHALKLDPNSLIVRVAHAFKCFAYNEREKFFITIDKCLAMKPNNSARLGALAFHMSLYGDWERGKKILDNLMCTNLGFPLYFHGATSLYYYRIKDYSTALEEADKYNLPLIFWGPMLRAAALGQLNKTDLARENIIRLKQLKPEFEKKARYLISRYVKEDELVDHILDGIRIAGMVLN